MRSRVALPAVIAILTLGAWQAAGQELAGGSAVRQLAAAKALYASASYEEALVRLDSAYAAETMDQVDQYRALCLLALDRIVEAERALEGIVRRAPLYRMSDADVSPRLVALFGEVRRRSLPQTVREIYARAKFAFDWGDFPAAAADFRRVLALVADPDLANAPRDLWDLRLLAEGFIRLAEAQPGGRPAKASGGGTTSNGPPRNGSESSPDFAKGYIYTADDRDVKAPIELVRRMPIWTPPAGYTEREFRGALELIIDASGNVEAVRALGPVMPNYDEDLRAAAKQWKYRPAMLRDGTPVRYRLQFGYLLKPLSF